MTYEQIFEYIKSPFIYAGVTDAEYAALPVSHYMAILGSVRYIGTDVELDMLAEKLLKPEVAPESPEQE